LQGKCKTAVHCTHQRRGAHSILIKQRIQKKYVKATKKAQLQ